MPTSHSGDSNDRLLDRIYQSPAPNDLKWSDVFDMVKHRGTVKEDGDRVTITVKSASRNFHRADGGEVLDDAQIGELRHFLEEAGLGRSGGTGSGVAVAITRKAAIVFHPDEAGADPHRIVHADPNRLLQDVEGNDAAARSPDSLAYYEEIATALVGGGSILLMGGGTGAGNAAHYLKEYLEDRHPKVAERIVTTITRDVESLSEGALLHEAREFFAAS